MPYYAHVPFSFLHPATSNECIDVSFLSFSSALSSGLTFLEIGMILLGGYDDTNHSLRSRVH